MRDQAFRQLLIARQRPVLTELPQSVLVDLDEDGNALVLEPLRGQLQANLRDGSDRYTAELDRRARAETVHRAVEVDDETLRMAEELAGADRGNHRHGEREASEHEGSDERGVRPLTHRHGILLRLRYRE